MGIRASETGLIAFDDVFVPEENLLGAREGTYPLILNSLMENRVGVAANAVGMARGAFEAALDFARTRLVSGKRAKVSHQPVEAAHRRAQRQV